MILTLTPNPCVDKTVFVDQFEPGERIRATRCTNIAGGKGSNVSRVAKMLGYETVAMNIVGGPVGEHVVQMLEAEGIACAPCRVAGMTRTITTVLEESLGRQTAFFDPGSPVTEEEAAEVIVRYRELLTRATIVTLNGTVPDPRLNGLYRECIADAKAAGIPVILDAHGPAFAEALGAGPDVIKPNLEEAAEAVGFALEDEAAQWRAVEVFHAQGVELVALSRGEQGILLSRGGERLVIHPPKICEVNPVGSGDALVAGIAVGLMEGWALEEIGRFGAALGAANAAQWGIATFTRAEAEKLLPGCRVERAR